MTALARFGIAIVWETYESSAKLIPDINKILTMAATAHEISPGKSEYYIRITVFRRLLIVVDYAYLECMDILQAPPQVAAPWV